MSKTLRTVVVLFCSACVLFTGGAAYGQARSEPIGVGDIAPDFTLVDHNGQKRALSEDRGKRPVVLIFYRGHW